jgi:hypothetical protein
VSQVWAWGSYGVLALCMVGGVAWPLWSDNDLWMIFFGVVGAAVIIPVVVWPSIRGLRDAFSSSEEPPEGR